MEFFHKAKAVRLRSPRHEKYLIAQEDQESIRQDRNGSSGQAQWTVEFVPGSDSIIRLRSCYDKYLTASEQPFLIGLTGRQVLQTLPARLDSPVEWEPIKCGNHMRLRSRHGHSFLRANGRLPPWRNTVTHFAADGSTPNSYLDWDAEILEIHEGTTSDMPVDGNIASAPDPSCAPLAHAPLPPRQFAQLAVGEGNYMEDIRLAGTAYYNNCSNEIQQVAKDIFRSIDTSGDGRVSSDKFNYFLESGKNSLQPNFYKWVVDSQFFTQIDANGDGSLDFSEFLTFFYLLITRHVFCSSCQANLPGLYFTCLDCFDSGITTFDLCTSCYGDAKFCHQHNQFLDSFVLLRRRSKAGISSSSDPAPTQTYTHVTAEQVATQEANGERNDQTNGKKGAESAPRKKILYNVGKVAGGITGHVILHYAVQSGAVAASAAACSIM